MDAARNYAKENTYQIAEEFGGTYESAKSDFTRKEFKRLIDKVTASRHKPYAILVYKMSRFSRSGGNAIGLVSSLVEDLGVHLIEVCSGRSTTTERGKEAIYESLFHAYKENLEKKEIIIPSMKAYLRSGNLMGKSPEGYDHYGPRVRDERFLAKKQRLEVNNDGLLLKQAWQWKLSGLYSDAEILSKLAVHGLRLLPQKISKIWRNPFYCGILINKLIEEPVKGNWEPLVSKRDFIRVQEMLNRNSSGYQQNKAEKERPLTRLIKCSCCGNFLVGHRNKKRDLHYFRCLKCKGFNLNVHTSHRSKREGANELFINFLKNFRLPDEIAPLVELQLMKLFHHYNENHEKTNSFLNAKLSTAERKMKDLKIRHALGDIDRESYDLAFEHLSAELQQIIRELNITAPKLSNAEKLDGRSLEKLRNVSEIWASSNLDNQRRIQKVLFPEGILYDAQKHEYRTEKTNSFILLTSSLAWVLAENKKGNFQDISENSLLVARTGIEPVIPP